MKFLCDDCRWAWRSCKHKGYPNVFQCPDYESRIIEGEIVRSLGNMDRVDRSGKIWRGDKYWDNQKGWVKPNLLSRLFKRK